MVGGFVAAFLAAAVPLASPPVPAYLPAVRALLDFPPALPSWREAADRVEEDRGEPVGTRARVVPPPELRHYGDRHRFLAVQVAHWMEQQYELPLDWVDLVALIEEEQLVAMPALGGAYILYGVGASATAAPFTYHDPLTRREVELFPDQAAYAAEKAALSARARERKQSIEEARRQLRRTSARNRTRRGALTRQVQAGLRALAAGEAEARRLAYHYEQPQHRDALFARHREIAEFAATLPGAPYDLQDPDDRRRLKGRLLTFARPEARDVILELASAYHARFGRPLPITSLVRTRQYQRHLGTRNRNATRIEVPPHATGLAFDVSYQYMASGEQEFLMREIARMEEEGRVEALRENRNHFHVFAFARGAPPPEPLVARSLKVVTGRTTLRSLGLRASTPPAVR